MSTAEYTITLHNTDNSAHRSSAVESAQTTQTTQREPFRVFIEKYIIGTVIAFTMLITLIFSVYAATRIEYLPSALILMVTLGVISYLLEKDGEQNGYFYKCIEPSNEPTGSAGTYRINERETVRRI